MRRTWVKYLVTWIRSTDAFTISGLQNAAPYILALVTPYMIKHRLQACKVMDLYASLDIHQPWSLNRSKPTASLSGPWREEKRERKRGCVISIRENSARSAITTTLNGWTFEVPWKQTPILHMSHCVTTAVMYGVWCFWKHKPCWKITITKKKPSDSSQRNVVHMRGSNARTEGLLADSYSECLSSPRTSTRFACELICKHLTV